MTTTIRQVDSASRSGRGLIVFVVLAVIFLGAATFWSFRSEGRRLEDEERERVRQLLGDAAERWASTADRRIDVDVRASVDRLRDGTAGRIAYRSSAEPFVVLFDIRGRRLEPARGASMDTEDGRRGLDPMIGKRLRDVEALVRGEAIDGIERPVNSDDARDFDAMFAELMTDDVDAIVRAEMTFLRARRATRAGRVDVARGDDHRLIKTPTDGTPPLLAWLSLPRRYVVLRDVLDRHGRRIEGGDDIDAARIVTAAETYLLPSVIDGHFAARRWAEDLTYKVERLGATVDAENPRLAARWRQAVRRAVSMAERLDGVDDLAETTLRTPIPITELRAVMHRGRRHRVRTIEDDDGRGLGAAVVIPPSNVAAADLATLATRLGADRRRVSVVASSPSTNSDVVRRPLTGAYTGLDLVAVPVASSRFIPWRTIVGGAFLATCLVVFVLGVRQMLKGIRRERELVENRRQLLHTVAHQIKTPAANLSMFAETLSDESVGKAHERRRMLDILRSEATRLSCLLERLLRHARLEGRAAKPDVADEVDVIDVATVVDDVERRWQAVAASRGRELRVDRTDIELLVAGDAAALTDCLDNLVDNALRFTRPNVPVALTMRCDDGRVTVRVEDGGPGITEADRERVFEPFFSSHDDGTGKSSGLGLAIAREGARLLGGDVEIEATSSEGTTMAFSLPLRTEGD